MAATFEETLDAAIEAFDGVLKGAGFSGGAVVALVGLPGHPLTIVTAGLGWEEAGAQTVKMCEAATATIRDGAMPARWWKS